MKKIILVSLLNIALWSVNSYAGGKMVIPAEAPTISIPTESPLPWYLGGGIVGAKLHGCNLTNCSYEDVTYGAIIRGGYELNQYFGIEARVLRTFLDKGPFGGAPLQHFGLYVKPQYPLSEQLNVYTLLGYGYTKNLGNGKRLNYFDNDHGFSAGIGIEYDLSDSHNDFINDVIYNRTFDGYADQGKGWAIFFEYQRLLIKLNILSMDIISFGLRYDF